MYLTAGFFAKDLFARHPAILINKVNPVFQDSQALWQS